MYKYKCEDCGKILELKEKVENFRKNRAHVKENYTYYNGSNWYCHGIFHVYFSEPDKELK